MIDKKKIKIIGFDLDQTLYEKSPEIDAAIQKHISEKVAEFKGCSIKEAKKLFEDLYQNGAGLSGGQSLRVLGLENGSEIVQEALETADIDKFLSPNPKTKSLLLKLKKNYANIDLITGSGQAIAEKKLTKLELDKKLFSLCLFRESGSKAHGRAFEVWLEHYKKQGFKPENFLYVGDRAKTDFIVPRQYGIAAVLVNIESPDENLDCPQLPRLQELNKFLLD